AHYGKYTVDGTDYFLNGLGQIEWEGVGGTASAGYTFVEDKDGFRIFDVFERKVVTETKDNPDYDPDNEWSAATITTTTYVNVGYYQLKVATEGGSSTFEKIMVTVTVGNATTTGTGPATTQVNAKVEALPEALKDATGAKIFIGWYTDPELETPATAIGYEVGDTPTLYAKWETRVTVTVHLNYEDKTEVYEFAEGATANIPELTRDGYYLVGLYTDEDCTDGNEWAGNGAAINANAVVYAKWALAAQMAGTYKGDSKYNNNFSGTMSMDSSVFTCAIDGTYTYKSGGYTDKTGTLSAEQKAYTDNSLVLGIGDSNDRYAYFNKAAGLIIIGWNSGTTSASNAIWVGFDTSRVASVAYSTDKYIDSGKLPAWFTITYKDGSTMNAVFYNDTIYDNVTWTAGVSASGVSSAKEIQVWDKENNEIFLKVKIGSSDWGNPGAERGEYTTADGETLFLNGGDQVVYGDKKGTYSAVTGKDYNFNVDLDGARYWLTVDGQTFSIEKPMATIEFNMNGKGEMVTT
ncbi:MAG: hypothetical protein K2J30_04200, partial [Clostridia bacterium]|nr:hypothetical protein [Clostridia bacterium]